IQLTIRDANNIDVSSNYQLTYDLGTLSVTRRALTVNTDSAVKVYDGLALTNPTWSLSSGELVAGDQMQTSMTAEITNAGTINNTILVHIFNESNVDVTNNYVITYDLGVLHIEPRPITIETEGQTKVYDGLALQSAIWTMTSGELVEGQTMEVSMNSQITNVGTVKNDISISIVDALSQDVTDNYEISYSLGNLTITPRQLTFLTEDQTKVYDGLPLTSDGWSLIDGTLLDIHMIQVFMYSSITNPGQVDNLLYIWILDESSQDVSSNYHFNLEIGTLTVTKREISIETDSLSKVYDGLPLTSDGWTLQNGSLLAQHHIDATMSASITAVGTTPNTVSIVIRNESNVDVTSYYTITKDLGTLSVTKREITISTESLSKVYDGLPLTSTVWSVQNGSVLTEHHIVATMNAQITNVGSLSNTVSIVILDEFDLDVTNFYTITKELGSLVVTPRPITIDTESVSKVYDGLPLTSQVWNIQSGSLVGTDSIDFVMDSSATNVSTTTNLIRITIADELHNDRTSNYEITFDYGTLTITPRPLTIQSESKEKVYDGLPITSSVWFQSAGVLLDSHHLEATMNSSRISAGTTTNVVFITVLNELNQDMTSN
ncbi:MAG: hypothetical protein PHP32_05545, partial [Candidatus Izemoplasmatales bacterium]|nr:hypothetical protein [Candidatus Izemoplasmatales bacterium]